MLYSHKNLNSQQRNLQSKKQVDTDKSCILAAELNFMPGLQCLVRTSTAELTASLGNPQWTQILYVVSTWYKRHNWCFGVLDLLPLVGCPKTQGKMKSGSIVTATLQKVSFVHVDTKC